MKYNIFDLKYIKSYFKLVFMLGSFIILINGYLFYNTMYHVIKNTTFNVHNILKYEGIDHNLICIGSDCSYIIYNKDKYIKTSQMILKKTNKDIEEIEKIYDITYTFEFDDLLYTSRLNLLEGSILISTNLLWYDNQSYKIKSNLNGFYINLRNNTIIILILFYILFTIGYIRFSKDKHRTDMLETFKNNAKLENKYQKVISESAHHEMMQPVAAIKTFSEELMRIYGLAFSKKGCSAECLKTGEPCSKKGSLICSDLHDNPYIKESSDYFSKIENSIQQLEVVLGQMRDTKHFKYSNGDKSIYQLLDNISSTMQVFNIDKFEPSYINREVMEKYSVYNMSNGEFLNVVSNHITNSIEAKANKIIFQIKPLNKKKENIDNKNNEVKYISLFIIDNGVGIRNEHKEIISSNEQNKIFNAGVSTKDQDGNHIIIKERRSLNILNKIKRGIIQFSTYSKEEEHSFRGVGLYVNKTQLNRYGGDLSLIETSEKGTVFKITIPVKLTRKAAEKIDNNN